MRFCFHHLHRARKGRNCKSEKHFAPPHKVRERLAVVLCARSYKSQKTEVSSSRSSLFVMVKSFSLKAKCPSPKEEIAFSCTSLNGYMTSFFVSRSENKEGDLRCIYPL